LAAGPQSQRLSVIEKLLENVNVMAFPDMWGPEKVIHVYDACIGMEGIVIIDNTARGPGKGGVSIRPGVTPMELFRNARTMTWTCALADLPFGGAMGSVSADPYVIDKIRLIKAFARAVSHFVPDQWVPAPAMNVGEREIEAFVNEIGDLKAATGKPERLGGIPHELGITGFGVGVSIETTLEILSQVAPIQRSIEGLRVAIHGFGNVGSALAKYLSNKGAKIVGLSDYWGAAYSSEGIDVSRAIKHARADSEARSIKRCKGAAEMPRDDLPRVDCDVLVPACVENVITEKNAGLIKAKLVVEAANNPTTSAAEEILFKNGILVIPDLLANAGGAIGSHAECSGLSAEKAFALIDSIIRRNTRLVLKGSIDSETISLPRAVAINIAMERVSKALRAREGRV